MISTCKAKLAPVRKCVCDKYSKWVYFGLVDVENSRLSVPALRSTEQRFMREMIWSLGSRTLQAFTGNDLFRK